MKYGIFILAAAMLAVGGCTSAVQKPSAGADREPAAVAEADVRASYSAAGGSSLTFLDSLNRGKEVALTDDDLPTLEVTAVASLPAAGPKGETRFRIQILASSQIDMVRQEKLNAEAATGLPVFMASEQPLYKLYVGDFKTKADADAALPAVKSKGYRDAWVVTVKN
jgi:hypothetical protein